MSRFEKVILAAVCCAVFLIFGTVLVRGGRPLGDPLAHRSAII